MMPQTDRDLIQNFVVELQPYLETVESGVQEFAGPAPDGIVVGQAVQALGMIRGAGSVLQIEGLVTIADLTSEAFEVMQQRPDLDDTERVRRLRGLMAALRDFLAAIDGGDDASSIVLRARTIFDSIPDQEGHLAGTARLGDRRDLDALFEGYATDNGTHEDDWDSESASDVASTADQPTDRIPTGEGRDATISSRQPADEPAETSAERSQDGADVNHERPEPVDPELREIFEEEAAALVISFGESAKTIARRPADFDAISQLRRDAHTLKGAANMTGFTMIGTVGSSIESLLDEHLEREQPVSRETLELLVVCWKMLRAMLKRLDDLGLFSSPSSSVVQRATMLRDRLMEPATIEDSDHIETADEVISVGHVPAAQPEPTAPESTPAPVSDGQTEGEESVRPDLLPTDEIPTFETETASESNLESPEESSDEVRSDESPVNFEDLVVSPDVESGDDVEAMSESDHSETVDAPDQYSEPAVEWSLPDVDEISDEPTIHFQSDAAESGDDPFFAPIVESEDEAFASEFDAHEPAIGDDEIERLLLEGDVEDRPENIWDDLDGGGIETDAAWADFPDEDPVMHDAPMVEPDPFFLEPIVGWQATDGDEIDEAPDVASPLPPADQPAAGDQTTAGNAARHDADDHEMPVEQPESLSAVAPSRPDLSESPPETGGLSALASGLGGQIDDLNAALLEMAFQPTEQPASGDVSSDAGLDVLDETVELQLAREMFETFALECADYLNAISRAAMQLDRDPAAPEPLREVRRVLHTLKGAAAAADVEEISNRCHELEDALAAHDAAGQAMNSGFVSELFAGIDEIEQALDRKRRELRGDDVQTPETSETGSTLRVDLTRIDDLLNTVGELVVSRAGLEQRLERLAATLDELSLAASRLQRSSYQLERETQSDDSIGQLMRSELSRGGSMVSIERIRQEQWDELELERYTEFDRLIRQLAEVGADVSAAVAEIQGVRGDLDTISNRQRRLTNAMQDELMGIRMVPIASTAPGLYRVVRRVADRRGKQVNLVFEGGDTPFDKMLLDALNEPLLHLLRNAVDHGIESPEERRSRGKPETGSVKIRAHHEGSEAIIDIIDDGAGIDHERVLESARERGLDVPDDITRQQALRYLFMTGFSTRPSADDVSGRGVGLEIVERAIENVKGRLSIDSLPGQGTMFSLRLPLQLSVTQAFLVEAGGGQFAIPIANIEYVAERVDQPLTELGDAVVVEVNDATIPVVDIADRFGQASEPILERDEGWVMIAEIGGRRWALLVDSLYGQQEVVVKPLGRFLRDQPALMGATILGNGEVALILDVPQILGGTATVSVEREFDLAEPESADISGDTVRDRGPLVALIVDDSLSVRRVVGRTLERHGWIPLVARDGVEGVEALENGDVDVVITDIEMPRMDGFDLLTSIRGNDRLSDVPVIVLTSRAGEKHRGRAFELGANAYLVKPFQEGELIEMVNRTAHAVPVAAQA